MYAVTAYKEKEHDHGGPLDYTREFKTGPEAHDYARRIKDREPTVEVTVTDSDGNTVELKENGWSRGNV